MEFKSILDNKKKELTEVWMPAYFTDLNLDQILEQIQSLSQTPVKNYYYEFPGDKAGEAYRREVYNDVKNEEVYTLLTKFTIKMRERNQAREKKQKVSLGIQLGAWNVTEVAAYCEACSQLYEGLLHTEIHSAGLLAFREYLRDYTQEDGYISMQKKVLELQKRLQGFRVKLVYENDQIFVTEDMVSGAYDSFLQEAMGTVDVGMKSPFSLDADLDDLEEEIIHKFAKKQLGFFEEVREFYHTYKEYENETLLQFSEEINFYLSYQTFQRKMELKGLAFVSPSVEEEKDMSAAGLYDLALACANGKVGKPVVSNDFFLGKGESFFVLTGPNQGGKTTFARSLGQLVYFSKLGLDVPAVAANVHYFTDILTHFSVEESVETGRGKLMDELVRLKPMMGEEKERAFVIINELFTTAANYDACIMGEKVLKHFIARQCRGIYVTHLKELTEACESVVSMRAMVDEQKVQNFKILRKESDDSVCAVNQVNKYRLTYEHLKERLG